MSKVQMRIGQKSQSLRLEILEKSKVKPKDSATEAIINVPCKETYQQLAHFRGQPVKLTHAKLARQKVQ